MIHPTRANYLKTLRHEIPSRVPVAIYNAAPFTTAFTGMDINAYYRSPELKMAAQLKLLDLLPGIVTIPPLWADFGPVLECSAFGSEILWLENDPPFAKPAIRSYQEIEGRGPRSPHTEGKHRGHGGGRPILVDAGIQPDYMMTARLAPLTIPARARQSPKSTKPFAYNRFYGLIL